ncbi:hypothetical protein xavtCFBP7764_23575 [Xanthomonas citri]|nr:hypothetical protein xavtCFBP7764_23575 [Xanthomonas citri]
MLHQSLELPQLFRLQLHQSPLHLLLAGPGKLANPFHLSQYHPAICDDLEPVIAGVTDVTGLPGTGEGTERVVAQILGQRLVQIQRQAGAEC